MAIQLTSVAELVAKRNATKVVKAKKEAVKGIPVDNTNRFVLSTQTLNDQSKKIMGRIYDPKVAAALNNKDNVSYKFALIHRNADGLFLVGVSPKDMADIQVELGKSPIIGSDSFQITIPKGERMGEVATVDNRRQINNSKFGTKVISYKEGKTFEVPTAKNQINATISTIGEKEITALLNGKNIEFVIGEATKVSITKKVRKPEGNGKVKTVEITKEFNAFTLTQKTVIKDHTISEVVAEKVVSPEVDEVIVYTPVVENNASEEVEY